MSLTSTAFMTAPGGFSTTLSSKLDKVDCSQLLAAVLKADTSLLGHIKMGVPGKNIEVNWIEDELNPAYILCSSSASNRITLKSTYATASLQRFLRKYTLLSKDEGTNTKGFMVQTKASISALTATVAAYGSVAWASWTMTKCYLVAQPWKDIDSASSDMSLTRTKRKNFMQVFEKAIEITQTRKNMDMEAVIDELQLQVKRRTLEIKRELELSVIRGIALYSSGFTADSELRTMAGILQLVRDYNLDKTNEDSNVINASAALTIANINSLAYKIYDNGGLDETSDCIILVGPKQGRVIASFEKELRRVDQGERTTGYYRNLFLSDMGVEFPIVMSRWMDNTKLCILDRSRMFLKPLQGDSWHLEKMAKTGRNEKWQLSGQYTLEFRNADKVHGLLYGLS